MDHLDSSLLFTTQILCLLMFILRRVIQHLKPAVLKVQSPEKSLSLEGVQAQRSNTSFVEALITALEMESS